MRNLYEISTDSMMTYNVLATSIEDALSKVVPVLPENSVIEGIKFILKVTDLE